MGLLQEKNTSNKILFTIHHLIQDSRLLAQRMKYLTRLHISAIFFCRVAMVVLALLDCTLSVSFWTKRCRNLT